MNNDQDRDHPKFEDAVQSLRRDDVPEAVVQAAGERVWNRLSGEAAGAAAATIAGCSDVRSLLPAFRAGDLSADRALLVEDHLHECVGCRREHQQAQSPQTGAWALRPVPRQVFAWDSRRMAVAAMLFVVVGLSAFAYRMFYAPLPGDRGTLQSATGHVYLLASDSERPLLPGAQVNEGDVIRTDAGSHAVIRLFDGSLVEMNERAEFSVSARRRATTVHLGRGHIIVQAAKQHGHLYVSTDACKISVTGTVFAVDSGMKGTRVSVIEGEVHVDEGGSENVLHSGDQIATSPSMGEVPIAEDISWSQNREEHLALLAEFSKLQKKFESIASPALRYDSAVLPIAPQNTLIYASVPNYGEQIAQANQMFQDELRQSEVLRQWWQANQLGKDQEKFQEMVDRIQTLGKFLGNEVVFMLVPDANGRTPVMVVAAQVTQPGLRDYLQAELDRMESDPARRSRVVVLDDQSAANKVVAKGNLAIMAGRNLLLASTDGQVLQSLAAQRLAGGNTAFAGSAFGQAIAASYQEGAGLLFAANLEDMIRQHVATDKPSVHTARHAAGLQQSGFGQARFLVAKRREQGGAIDNRATLTFSSQRSGIASWLAAPSGIGSLDFISPDAVVVVAATVKSPVQMVDDVLSIMQVTGDDPSAKRSEFRSKMNFDIRDDLAASLGGDFAFALDGPMVPTPAWKFVVEVNDQQKLQNTLQLAVQDINNEATTKGHPGVTLERTESDGRIFYVLKHGGAAAALEMHYTFVSGYMVAAPSHGLLMKAINIRESGVTLARSANFTSLLPKDQHADVSGILYQNLVSVAGPLAEQLNPNEAQSLQTIVANARPSLVVAYGDADRIEVATASKFFGLDVNNFALSQLLHLSGTPARPAP